MTDIDFHDLTKEQRAEMVAKLGLTIEAVFVPFSQSRNKAEKMPSLNWRVTVKHNGRAVLETDYMAGSGHCPAYKASVRAMGGRDSIMRTGAIAWECEHGFEARAFDNANSPEGYTVRGMHAKGKPLQPDTLDVLASLAMDSDVLDAGGFEDWARDLGFDTDSRKAEATYKACIEIALKLRAALGDTGLASLRNAFMGY